MIAPLCTVKRPPDGNSVDSPWVEFGPGTRKRTRTFSNGLVIEEKDVQCPDCGKPWPDMFIVKDHLWREFGVGKGLICLNCFERRLGRKIVPTDLQPCGCTRLALRLAGMLDENGITEKTND